MSETKKGNFIAQAWLVILLALCYGGGLAAVQMSLGPKIEQNKLNETLSVIPQLVPGALQADTPDPLFVEGENGKTARIFQAKAGEEVMGWVIPGSGLGFADKIELLIGTDAELSTITGLYVLDQKETPGLGDYITGEDFRSRFAGKPATTPLQVVKSEPQQTHQILALTGATISSEAVSGIVNQTLANLRGPLLAQMNPSDAEAPEADPQNP